VLVQLLIATERQKRLALTAAIAAVVNIAANFALIPQMGALGAATSTVITEAVVITLNFAFLPRELTRQLHFVTLGKTVVSAAAMVAVLQLASGQSLLLLVPLGMAAYLASVIVLRAIPPDDWAMMKSALANLLTA
jgi:O-antigen/teichoic acid export membrane protein